MCSQMLPSKGKINNTGVCIYQLSTSGEKNSTKGAQDYVGVIFIIYRLHRESLSVSTSASNAR